MKNKPWSVLMAGAYALGLAPSTLLDARMHPDLQRFFTGGRARPRRLESTPSKYSPHQGAAECARRRRQLGLGEFRAGRAA